VSDTVVEILASVSVEVNGVLTSSVLAGIAITLPPTSAVTIVKDEVDLQTKLSTLLHELVDPVENVILVVADPFLFEIGDVGGGGSLVSLSNVNHKDTDDSDVGIG